MKSIFTILLIISSALLVKSQRIAQQEYPEFTVDIYGEGPSMFLIPGAACSSEVWRSTIEEYQSSYEIHAFTLAGYAGVSPLEDTPMLEQIKSAIVSYITEEKNDEAVLIGHSIGGWLALKIAIEEQDLINKLIIVDALPFLPAATNPAATEDMMQSMSPELIYNQYQAMDSAAFAQMQLQTVRSMIKDVSFHDQVLRWSLMSDKKAMAYTVYEMMSKDLRRDIADISTKGLVLGAWDSSYPNDLETQTQIYEKQYELASSLEVKMIDTARHFIMLDQPKRYFEQVDLFLSNLQK